MKGTVSQLHALLEVPFRLSSGSTLSLEFVVDTGFTGFLTLPLGAVTSLGLPLVDYLTAHLADHSLVRLPVYGATILWEGEALNVEVLGTGERPLLGTALLEGYKLLIEFAPSGEVAVEKLLGI